ncbi:predicted protein [Arabidopsis lyrata subsp. lyrata]|uniref:Predicted protein n=1 Tax=Arabidopsis lyrata subsp. lyrata TaxID=81972 RepID=D7L826_ARALL|nr:predicted protein [Arabidopsis lyrata subsp. lyrata]
MLKAGFESRFTRGNIDGFLVAFSVRTQNVPAPFVNFFFCGLSCSTIVYYIIFIFMFFFV